MNAVMEAIAVPILKDLHHQIQEAGTRILEDGLPDKVRRFDAEVERLTAECRQRIHRAVLIVAQPPSDAVQ